MSPTLVPDLVVAQARRRPEALAVRQWDERLTYADLVGAAARLAGRLCEVGVGPEVRVGVCLRRRPALVAALLGVHLAGGAYVPLDPDLPARRLEELVADAGLEVVVTDDACRDLLVAPGLRLVDAGEGDARAAPGPCPAHPECAAYVLYTSGSTGRPKGVVVTHRSVAAFAAAMAALAGVNGSSRVLAYASIGFDVSVMDILVPLSAGGAAMLVPDADRVDPARLQRFAEAHGVTWGTPPPALLPLLDPGRLPDWRVVTTGAEAPGPEQVERWTAGGRRFFNCYGPTEATVCVTAFEASGRWDRPLPIGRPYGANRVHVVDAGLRPAPAAEPGEVLIGGPGLARGYLGRPDLTAQAFVPDPFGPEPGGRLYRTGDLAAWGGDGELRFLGRRDRQVKVRGQRVEIGEVETALRGHPAVAHAVAVAVPGPDGLELVAFVAPASAPSEAELRAHCGERLPAAMVPGRVLRLAALPLTASGKVDEAALGELLGRAGPAEGVRPSDPLGVEVAAAWCRALAADAAGLDDDFFDRGGHSVTAMRLVADLRDRLGRLVAVEDVFAARTLGALVDRVAGAPETDASDLAGGRPPALSAAQRRLWFVDRLTPGTAAYNIAMAERLAGPLDAGALRAALGSVARRHDVLRWRIEESAGVPKAVVDPAGEVRLPIDDLSRLPPAERAPAVRERLEAGARTGFDLAAGPLWRARLLRLAPDDHVLAITAHHAVFDGWSQAILYRDLGAAYAAIRRGDPAPGPTAVGFADYVAWRDERERRRGAGDLSWWVEHLAGAPALLDLPRDRPRPGAPAHRGAAAGRPLHPALDRGVRALAAELTATPSTVTLAAFAQLLHRVTGRRDLVVGTPVADRRHPAFQDLVGFFVDIVPLRLRIEEGRSFAAHVLAARDELLQALAHPEATLERIVQALGLGRDPSRSPLVQVVFNVYNFAEPRLELPGLDSRPIPAGVAGSAFDLTVYLVERDGRLALDAVYDADLYDAWRVDALLAAGAGLLGELVGSPARPAGAASLEAATGLRAGLSDGDALPAASRRGRADAPATPAELTVAEVWREVLGVAEVGAGDNFFEIGGTSLALAAVQARLGERVGRQLRLVDLFRHPNVRGLAAHLDGSASDDVLDRAAERVAARRERLRRRAGRREEEVET